MLNIVHESHLGIVKCKPLPLEVAYWPAINSNIEEPIANCTMGADFQRKQPSEPLIPAETPGLSFMMVGTDLFDFESKTYLLTVDYYSRFIGVDWLHNLRSKATIEALKAQFSRNALPEVTEVRSSRLRNCKILQRIQHYPTSFPGHFPCLGALERGWHYP